MEPEMSTAGGESSSGAVIPEETSTPRTVSGGFGMPAGPRGSGNKTAGTVHRNVVTGESVLAGICICAQS